MTDAAYRVLARKYRPHRFDDLIGQEVLVRTLTNAFSSGRIAHAFLLTGIRGIGKTTTARIIARGLNCIGPDGMGSATTDPCGECPNCQMILQDRHVDVIEMDAASRTGVDDIREIIDTVRYAPTSARYKIYIIDEVHMLSKNAFNALLKTLEEPPAHVKFIFATTELRKIPITIISRCQRFDLKRIEIDALAAHLQAVCQKEAVAASPEALALIATAAEGSVRDSLSLLDQAIAMSTDEAGTVSIEELAVRSMLGMADKTRSFALLEHCFKGAAKEAIEMLRELYARGGDPLLLMGDLLEITHFITRVKLAAGLSDHVQYSDIEQQKARALAEKLSLPVLTRAWQMLLKGMQEIKIAPHPLAAAEMILVRLAHSSDLPSPEELIRKLEQDGGVVGGTSGSHSRSAGPSQPTVMQQAVQPQVISAAPISGNLALAAAHAPSKPAAVALAVEEAQPQPALVLNEFLDMLALFETKREPLLYSHLYNDVRLISFAQGRVVVRPINHIPTDFAARVSRYLSQWTGEKWLLTYGEEEGEPSLREQEAAAQRQRMAYAKSHPSVQKIMALFPDSEVVSVEPVSEETSEGEKQ